MKDERVCPICRELEGYIWVFEAGKDELGNALIHPIYGVVWDTVSGSQAHGHKGNCRCHISHEIDLGDLLERIRAIRTELERVASAQGKEHL